MKPLSRCERCGAQAAGYMDIDFRCNRRRCPIRSLLDAKRELARVAYDGGESRKAQREALKVMLETLQFCAEHEDETEGMSPHQYSEWLEKHGSR